MECSQVDNGQFVRSHCETTPLLEPGDASLDSIALLVRLGVEGGRPASHMTASPSVTYLVGRLGNDGTDPAPTEMAPDRTGRIRAVRQNSVRPDSRSSRPKPRDTNACQHRFERRRIARLACGHVERERERTSVAVAGKMHLVLRPPRERPSP